jgi:voltage-gated potassium channel Kch
LRFVRRGLYYEPGLSAPAMTDGAPGPLARPARSRLSAATRARWLGAGSAGVGALLVGLGIASASNPIHPWYATPLTGYDPPFDVISGMILLALCVRLGARRAIAWLFSLIAPMLAGAIAVFSPNPYSVAAAAAASVLMVFIYPTRAGFYRGSPTGPEATQSAFLVASLLTVLYGTVGSRWLGNQFSPAPGIQNWGEALYFTMCTISTIGSQWFPATATARWFVVVLILVGVGTFLSLIVVIFGPFLEARLQRIGERLERSQMQELDRHVIVCGASPEAQATAHALRDAGVRVVVVAPDSRPIDLLKGDGFRTHLGDPSSEEDLKLVGIDRARSLVVAQESDASNLLTVITARALRPRLRIVAIAAQESTLPKLLRAGANEAISVVSVAARLVSSSALQTDAETESPSAAPS